MKIASTIVGVTAVLILLMAVALPIITDMQQSSTDPIYSDNASEGYKMSKSNTGSIVVTKTSDGVTAGGSAVSSGYAIVSSSMALQVTSSGFTVIASGLVQACNTQGDTMTISGSSWSLAYTADTAQTASGSFSWIFIPNDSGTYLNATAPVFVDDDSEIVVYGTAANSGRLVAKGTIDGGLSTVFKYTSGTATYSVSSEETGYSNTLNSVTATLQGSTATFTSMIVPVEYTTGYEESTMSTLVGIIPVILVTALIIAVVARVLPEMERGRE